jgi:hypothetical protein
MIVNIQNVEERMDQATREITEALFTDPRLSDPGLVEEFIYGYLQWVIYGDKSLTTKDPLELPAGNA